jgi:ATP-dependent RNA helicase DeaD
VINYELPDELEKYTHRSGRTGRVRKSGLCISIAKPKEKRKIKKLEKTVKKTFKQIAIPTAQDVRKKKVNEWADSVKEIDSSTIDDILPAVKRNFEGMERDEIIEKFTAFSWNTSIAKDSQTPNKSGSGGSHTVANGSEEGFERFFISLGKKDNLNSGKLISLINRETETANINIGKINIMDSFSFFEADLHFKDTILAAFRGKIKFRGRSVKVEIAKPKKS